MTTANELKEDVTRLMHEMLDACRRSTEAKTPEALEARHEAIARYIEKHRQWFALTMPELDYDEVYGSPVASRHEPR